MGAPITIKKRAVTVKSKAAPPQPVEPVDTEETTPPDEETDETPVLFSKPTPTASGNAVSAPTRATAVAAVLAVIATLILLFVILLQWTEWQDIQQLFPRTFGVITTAALSSW